MEEEKQDFDTNEGFISSVKIWFNTAIGWISHTSLPVKITLYTIALIISGSALFVIRSKNSNPTSVSSSNTTSATPSPSSFSSTILTSPFPKSLETALKNRRDQQNNSLAFQSESKVNSAASSSGNFPAAKFPTVLKTDYQEFRYSTKPNTPNLSSIALYFKDTQTGQLTLYQAPSANPDPDIIWKTYVNDADGYSIEYPYNWVPIKIYYVGHEGMAIYPIGVDTNLTVQDGLKEIGLGWSPINYQLPFTNPDDVAYSTPITVSRVDGTLYTQGVLGTNNVAAIFPYRGGYFGLGGTANTDDMIYVFRYMLASLKFIGQ